MIQPYGNHTVNNEPVFVYFRLILLNIELLKYLPSEAEALIFTQH